MLMAMFVYGKNHFNNYMSYHNIIVKICYMLHHFRYDFYVGTIVNSCVFSTLVKVVLH